jgi:hypothetical protein
MYLKSLAPGHLFYIFRVCGRSLHTLNSMGQLSYLPVAQYRPLPLISRQISHASSIESVRLIRHVLPSRHLAQTSNEVGLVTTISAEPTTTSTRAPFSQAIAFVFTACVFTMAEDLGPLTSGVRRLRPAQIRMRSKYPIVLKASSP